MGLRTECVRASHETPHGAHAQHFVQQLTCAQHASRRACQPLVGHPSSGIQWMLKITVSRKERAAHMSVSTQVHACAAWSVSASCAACMCRMSACQCFTHCMHAPHAGLHCTHATPHWCGCALLAVVQGALHAGASEATPASSGAASTVHVVASVEGPSAATAAPLAPHHEQIRPPPLQPPADTVSVGGAMQQRSTSPSPSSQRSPLLRGMGWLAGAAGRLADLSRPRTPRGGPGIPSSAAGVGSSGDDAGDVHHPSEDVAEVLASLAALPAPHADAAAEEAELSAAFHASLTDGGGGGAAGCAPPGAAVRLETSVGGLAEHALDDLLARLRTGVCGLDMSRIARPSHMTPASALWSDEEDDAPAEAEAAGASTSRAPQRPPPPLAAAQPPPPRFARQPQPQLLPRQRQLQPVGADGAAMELSAAAEATARRTVVLDLRKNIQQVRVVVARMPRACICACRNGAGSARPEAGGWAGLFASRQAGRKARGQGQQTCALVRRQAGRQASRQAGKQARALADGAPGTTARPALGSKTCM
eukprot:364685-Chlamydomonas_euryale.AAC.4